MPSGECSEVHATQCSLLVYVIQHLVLVAQYFLFFDLGPPPAPFSL